MAWYDRFLKPARWGPPAQLWLLVGFLLVFLPVWEPTRTAAPGVTVLVRNGQFQPLGLGDGSTVAPFDERWDIYLPFVRHLRPGRTTFTLTPSVRREGPGRVLLPSPPADEVWAALDAWIAANPGNVSALPPEFSSMAARHTSFEQRTDWRYYAFPAARTAGWVLLMGGSAICAFGLACEIRISREDSRHRRGDCPQCGYNRTTIPQHLPCPECGCTVSPRQLPID